jgi:hypothetical protein
VPSLVSTASGSYHYQQVNIYPQGLSVSISYLQILRGAVPDVNGLEKWIIAIVESTSRRVELVGEDQVLL